MMGKSYSKSAYAVELVERGYTYAEAGREAELWSTDSVYDACERAGVTQTKKAEERARRASAVRLKRASKSKLQKAVLLVGDGFTYSEAANEVGLTRCQVAGAVYRARRQGRQ